MPIATIKFIKGALTDEKKIELHRRFADLIVDIEGGNPEIRKYVILAIEEEEPINLGIAGEHATEAFLHNMTQAKAPNDVRP